MRESELFTIWLTAGVQVGDITVTRLAKKLLQVEHTQVWVPGSFTARVDRERLPIVELEVEYVRHERFRCKSVRVIARDAAAVDAEALRVPLKALMDEALERVSYREAELVDGEMVDFARWCYRKLVDAPAVDVDVDVDRIQVGDFFRFPVAIVVILDRSEYETSFGAHLRGLLGEADHSRRRAVPPLWVALEYDRAMTAGEDTGRAIAERFGWKSGRATNAIAAARKAGYLPPTEQGKARTFPRQTD
jgi:hypothetical protein